MTSYRTAIVLLNYRTPELTGACLESVAGRGGSGSGTSTEVIVVDNASGDGSADTLRREIASRGWGDWARLYEAERNLGFAGGNNFGIRHAGSADYVLLLNSDTIVHPGCLDACLARMEAERDIGAMSCLVLNEDGTVQNVSRKFPTPLRSVVASLGLPWKMPKTFGWADTDDLGWDRRATRQDVDWIGGAFMLLRREALDAVGLLDEDFFFYGEDIEICHRLQRAGWRVHYDPAGSITHLGGGSSDASRVPNRTKQTYAFAARYLVQRKCYGRWAAISLRLIDLAVWVLRLGWRFVAQRGHVRYQTAKQTVRILAGPIRSPQP